MTGQQGAAGDARPRDLRRRRPGGRAGLLRGRRGRRDPDHPAAARLARRRPRAADHGHRQRHDELHPRPHGHRGRRARGRPRRRASELGYAEADPTADIEGYDAAQKAAILASLAFHTTRPARGRAPRGHHRHRQGRRWMPPATRATSSSCSPSASGSPATRRARRRSRCASTRRSIDRDHPLATVHGANNAVFVAGGGRRQPHVLRRRRRRRADGLRGARRRRLGRPPAHRRRAWASASRRARTCRSSPIGRVTTRYQITLEVDDQPGVLATVARHPQRGPRLDRDRRADRQRRSDAGHRPPRHRHAQGTEQDLSDTVDRLAASGVVERVVSVLRVEGD